MFPFPLLLPTPQLPSILLLLSPLQKPALAKIVWLLNLMDAFQLLLPLTSQKHLPLWGAHLSLPFSALYFVIFLTYLRVCWVFFHCASSRCSCFVWGPLPGKPYSVLWLQTSSICWWLLIIISSLSFAPQYHISNFWISPPGCFVGISTSAPRKLN